MTDVKKNVEKDTLTRSQREQALGVLDLGDDEDDQDEQTNDRAVELGRS